MHWMDTSKFLPDRPREQESLIQYLHVTWPQLEIAQAAFFFFANSMLLTASTKYKHSYKSRYKWLLVLVQNRALRTTLTDFQHAA